MYGFFHINLQLSFSCMRNSIHITLLIAGRIMKEGLYQVMRVRRGKNQQNSFDEYTWKHTERKYATSPI